VEWGEDRGGGGSGELKRVGRGERKSGCRGRGGWKGVWLGGECRGDG